MLPLLVILFICISISSTTLCNFASCSFSALSRNETRRVCIALLLNSVVTKLLKSKDLLRSLLDLLVWFYFLVSVGLVGIGVLDENAAHRELALEHSRVERRLAVLCAHVDVDVDVRAQQQAYDSIAKQL